MNLIKDKFYKLDGFGISSINEDIVELFSIKVPDVTFISKNIETDRMEVPSWLNKFTYEDQDYYYGVGKFTSQNNCNDSWKTSEEQAIYNILTSISMKVFTLTRTEYIENENDKYLNYIRTDLKFKINGISTLERYPDESNGYYYTLVRIKKDKIVSYNK